MDKSNFFAQVDSSVRAAFAMWTGITDFSFTHKRSGSVHLEIRFVRWLQNETNNGVDAFYQKLMLCCLHENIRQEHGDGDSFDGIGGALAHSFAPQYGGDIHIDEDEPWTVDSPRGTNLFQVFAPLFRPTILTILSFRRLCIRSATPWVSHIPTSTTRSCSPL